MKDVTAAYIAKEEADQRKPVELYKIWRMDDATFWYYTSGDISVTFDGQTYVPAPLKRGRSKYDSNLEVSTMQIQTNFSNVPTSGFLSVNPIEILWIQIMKLHREQSPLEADVVFIGQIKSVSFKGVEASVQCVGFEHFLKKTIPAWRYQLTCNHQVFDARCGLTAATYKSTGTVTLDTTKTILTGTLFGFDDWTSTTAVVENDIVVPTVSNGYKYTILAGDDGTTDATEPTWPETPGDTVIDGDATWTNTGLADGHWVGGQVKFDVESRTVVAHVGDQVTIMYKMIELDNGETVDVFPGCDQRAETCSIKYNNILSFLGMKDIPVENPATRVTW